MSVIVYACIYGFSQAENQIFNGSLQYLADWTNSTKQGVIKCLKSLVDKGYIAKEEKYINGVKFCEYYATKFNRSVNKVDEGMQQSSTGGSQQSLPNKKGLDNLSNMIVEIIEYLNSVCGTKFKPATPKTQTLIKARLKEGFVVADFKAVIDKKFADWKGTEFRKYWRPETLFGPKFESYLNEDTSNNKSTTRNKDNIGLNLGVTL